MKLKGPYETEIIVHVTDGENSGKVTCGLSMGTLPTQEDIDEAVKKCEATLKEQGFRLMTKKEFFNVMMKERLGAQESYATPGGDEWDE